MSQPSNVTTLAPAAQQSGLSPSFQLENFWPKSWVEAQTYAAILAKAPSMLPKHIREAKDPAAEIFAHIMYGFEIGLAPIQALRALYLVHGRAGMYAAEQVALVQKHHDCERLEVATDKNGKLLSDATSCTWVTKRRSRTEQRLTFTIAEAEQEGLVAGNAKYKTAPAVMLRWRCATRLLAFTWGDVLRGMDDREQVEKEEKDGGWAERTTAPPPARGVPPEVLGVATPAPSSPPPADMPPHDPVTGELKEEAPAVEAEPVDELSLEHLVKQVEGAKSKEELSAAVTLINKAKAAGRVSPDGEMKLMEAYKATSAALKGAK